MNAHVLALLAAASGFTALAGALAVVGLGFQSREQKARLRSIVRDLRQRT